jgi:hypothetical protein
MHPATKETALQQIEDWHGVDREIFENEILPANRPAVLRGVLRDWPVVQSGSQSPASVANYLKQFDIGGTVNAFVGRPEINGRFFYSDDFQGFNFDSIDVSISTALDTLVSLADNPEPPAIALQAIEVPKMMPAFLEENSMPLLDGNVAPRVWISSQSMIAAHFDVSHNIACVVSGSRKFTVFPPDQISNLYIGPLVTTPGGPPISVVDLRNPDHGKFPRFARALESAQEAILEPGDAVYIPILWWHGVESLDALNILVNYWWNDNLSEHQNPMLSLIHTMALMSGLPAVQRDAWRKIFDCLAFQRDGEPGAHLPANLRDVMGNLSSAERDQALAIVAERLRSQTG